MPQRLASPQTVVKATSTTSSGKAATTCPRRSGAIRNRRSTRTVPRFRLEDVEVYSSSFEERLDEPAIHLPDTGFPRQPGANTYIAGHRVGYFGTGSFLVFVRLNELSAVDEVILEDPAGGKCAYRVTGSLVVEPEDASVMEPAPGKSIVSLRTCTLPDYSHRLIVRGELGA